MIELRDELYAMPMRELRHVPYTANRHKWWLKLYRFDDEGNFAFCFESPKKRRYFFSASRGENGGRVTEAEVVLANGEEVANYYERWGDKPERLDAVIRLTPKHILSRLYMLLDAIR